MFKVFLKAYGNNGAFFTNVTGFPGKAAYERSLCCRWVFGEGQLFRTSLSGTNPEADFLFRVARYTGTRKSPAGGFRTKMSERAVGN